MSISLVCKGLEKVLAKHAVNYVGDRQDLECVYVDCRKVGVETVVDRVRGKEGTVVVVLDNAECVVGS